MIDRRAMLLAAGALAAGGPARARTPRAAAVAGDLTGTWTNAFYTWLQRPKALAKSGLVLTPDQAEAYESPRRELRGEIASKDDILGQDLSEFPDNGPGLARVRGEIRSSWITDPADGRIPWIAGIKKKLKISGEPEHFDNVEDRDTDERCLTNASGAAPLLNSHDANLIQIVQTPGWIAIVGEKNHQTRIVEMAGPNGVAGAGLGAGLGDWMGVSIGHWEGATLVVETTRLRPGLTKISDDLYLTERSRVTERFTRTGTGEITYQFVVSDPSLFTQVWRAEEVFRTAEGQLFEYACHEGNYSLPGILQAARMGRQDPPEPEPPPPPPAKGGA